MPHVRGDCNRDSPHASPVSGRVCHRAGSGPDGAGPAPGLEKFRFLANQSPTTTTTTTTIAPAGRAGARPNRVFSKALPVVPIFPDISSVSPIRLQLSPAVSDCLQLASGCFRSPARSAWGADPQTQPAASVSGEGGEGIRRCGRMRSGSPALREQAQGTPGKRRGQGSGQKCNKRQLRLG